MIGQSSAVRDLPLRHSVPQPTSRVIFTPGAGAQSCFFLQCPQPAPQSIEGEHNSTTTISHADSSRDGSPLNTPAHVQGSPSCIAANARGHEAHCTLQASTHCMAHVVLISVCYIGREPSPCESDTRPARGRATIRRQCTRNPQNCLWLRSDRQRLHCENCHWQAPTSVHIYRRTSGSNKSRWAQQGRRGGPAPGSEIHQVCRLQHERHDGHKGWFLVG